MKKKHLLNIGYPKCSTTWLWSVLASQEWVEATHRVDKENYELLRHGDIQQYYETYKQFDISANFCPVMFAIDRYLIKQLANNPQIQVSIIVRNLFDLNFSLYSFLQGTNQTIADYQDNIDNLLKQGTWWTSPATIIQRWMEFFDSTRFKVFFYDDIKESNNEFLKNYCLQVDLPLVKKQEYPLVNRTTTYKENISGQMQDHQIEIFNEEIEKLEFLLEKDLSHWKQK